jgi:hypothetical protein
MLLFRIQRSRPDSREFCRQEGKVTRGSLEVDEASRCWWIMMDRLENMTGTFNSTVLAQLNGTSVATVAASVTGSGSTGRSSSTAMVGAGGRMSGSSGSSASGSGMASESALGGTMMVSQGIEGNDRV